MASSDGSKLALFEDSIDNSVNIEDNIILPRKSLLELSKIIDKIDELINITYSRNYIRFEFKDTLNIFSSKLIDSKYPNYSRATNIDFFSKINIKKSELKDALSRVIVLADEKNKGVTLEIDNNQIRLISRNPNNESAYEEINIEYSGSPIRISFSCQKLLEAINNTDTDSLIISISTKLSNIIIEPNNNSNYKYIVMSMRL